MGLKIVLTVVAGLGCWFLSYMPIVLRLVYTRFAAQETEILSKKLEPEEQDPLPADCEDCTQETTETDSSNHTDHSTNADRPAADV